MDSVECARNNIPSKKDGGYLGDENAIRLVHVLVVMATSQQLPYLPAQRFRHALPTQAVNLGTRTNQSEATGFATDR